MAVSKAPKRSILEPRTLPPRWGGSLADVAGEWLDSYYSYSPKTQSLYREAVVGKLLPWLATQQVTEIPDVKPRHLTAFFRAEFDRPRKRNRSDGDRPGHIASSSIHRLYSMVKTFFKWAAVQDYVSSSPMALVEPPRMPKRVRMGFTREEATRLIRWTSFKRSEFLRSRDRAIVTLLLDTALRAEELLALRVESIETRVRSTSGRGGRLRDVTDTTKAVEHWLRIIGKGDKERHVMMGPNAYRAVQAYLRSRPDAATDAMFVTQQGRALGYQGLWWMVKALGEYAGVEDCSPHRFRHTSATELYRDSKDILLVKTVLGHANVATTERYLQRVGVHYQEMEYRTPSSWLG